MRAVFPITPGSMYAVDIHPVTNLAVVADAVHTASCCCPYRGRSRRGAIAAAVQRAARGAASDGSLGSRRFAPRFARGGGMRLRLM